MNFFTTVMAGGSGTRLWPISTKDTPKQFLKLSSNRTMLQETVDRLLPLAPLERTFVVTFGRYSNMVSEQLTGLPTTNIIAEPVGRGTAASIGLAATFIAAQDPHAIMGSFSADHLITRVDEFQQALRFASEVAQDGYLVTLGIEPTYAETGYGYIQAAHLMRTKEEHFAAFGVKRFIEKPPLEMAEHFVQSKEYAWNAGIFVFRVDAILEALRTHVPQVAQVLDKVAEGIRQGRVEAALQEAWPALTETVTIDVGVMEKAKNIAMIPVNIGWNDIGNWSQLATLHTPDEHRNTARMEAGRHIAIDTRDTFVYSTTGRVIATAGVEGLVVVDTPDSLLICHKDSVQLVKNVTTELEK